MAKFCTKCGKALKEGEVCSCSKEEKTVAASSSNGGAFDDFGEIAKGTFTNPVTTIKKFSTDSNIIVALILLGACAVFMGIFTYVLCDEIVDSIASLFGALSGSASLLTGGVNADVSFASVFLKVFIYTAIYFVVLAAMLLLMTKAIFKGETSFKKILTIIGLSSGVMVCVLLLGTLFLKISIGLGLVIFIAGLIHSLIVLTAGSMEALEVKKDKMAYSLLASVSVALFVVLYVLPKLFS